MPSIAGQIIFLKLDRILKLLGVVFLIWFIYTVYIRTFNNNDNQIERNVGDRFYGQNKKIAGRPDLSKYVHLDLKGAPPKAEKFYEQFFEFLQKLNMGVKGILIEYEDTLPLQGHLINTTHRAGYTKSDIKLIQDAAKKYQLELIPLIQTFGHLEWILKLQEFRVYRDDESLPNVISPCYNATYVLLEDLLKQTLDLHPDSHLIHIGCDEVQLTDSRAQCDITQMTKPERYVDHIKRVVTIVQKIRPGIRVLIWDDILRNDEFITRQLLLNPVKNLVEPVAWNYFTKFNEGYTNSYAWKIYSKYFPANWVASAYKGGLHRFSMLTNTTHHVLNNYQWLQFIQSGIIEKDFLSGIILTGWSRFDHFMPLCDLLPTAYKSLIYSLHIINTNQFVDDDSLVNCRQLLKTIGKDSQLCELLPGLSIESSITSFSNLLPKIQSHLKLVNTVAPEYNRKNSFVRRYELDYFLSGLRNHEQHLSTIKQSLIQQLATLYSEDVVNEWIDLYLTPTENQIKTTLSEFEPARRKLTWPRRPLT